ncbi:MULTISPECIES: hypothetical protein [unclassified Streptomyces]|uniref:hypothetical protein n=1 Tax=unclassified Streptomyces TaxID=2593676 RepID=UPI003369E9C9
MTADRPPAARPVPRPAADLPGDPRLLGLEYHLSQAVGGADGDTLLDWTVSIRAKRFKGRTAGGVIGSMTLFRLRLDDRFGPHPFEAAESYGTELSDQVLGVYDLAHGGYRQEFREAVTRPDGDLLVLHHVELDPAWRGFGLGPILASEAIWTLVDGCGAVVVDPRDERGAARWESIGFRRRVRPLGHLLDPASARPLALRKERRADFDALAESYLAALRG